MLTQEVCGSTEGGTVLLSQYIGEYRYGLALFTDVHV